MSKVFSITINALKYVFNRLIVIMSLPIIILNFLCALFIMLNEWSLDKANGKL